MGETGTFTVGSDGLISMASGSTSWPTAVHWKHHKVPRVLGPVPPIPSMTGRPGSGGDWCYCTAPSTFKHRA